jgi:hypothetical protein
MESEPWTQEAERENIQADMARLKKKESVLYDHAEHSDYRPVKPIDDLEWFWFVGDMVGYGCARSCFKLLIASVAGAAQGWTG